MYANLIDAIRKDVLSLISRHNQLLSELLQTPDLLKATSEDDQEQRTDTQTVENWQFILDNESRKVSKLEMVLAVIGTMKAGKSTNINAIVGSQILPNRNQPMTSLPTLIRHRKGQTHPILFFPKRQPIETTITLIKKELIDLEKKHELTSVKLYHENDGKQLIENIINGKFGEFQELYQGQENIFDFLKSLNDLMRLSADPLISTELPIEEYTNIDDLPSIEVEFFHLANNKELAEGSFALLDTPGPNEYGLGEKLHKVLRTQIARASAILAVIDYTQLRSEAENTIREELASQIEQTEDRLFIFVNKFDQYGENGMGEDEVKRHVTESLMGGRITQERVYPVSARYAYLANRALCEIKNNGSLPDYQKNSWVSDFGKHAFRFRWKEKIQQVDDVIDAAEQLWEESYFEQPINEVIVKAASTAALVSMQAATAKMHDFGNKLENFLELRRGALTKSVEDIRKLISGLTQDIQNVEKAEVIAEQALKEVVDSAFELAKANYEDVKRFLEAQLDAYFKEGKIQEKSALMEMLRAIQEESERRKKQGIFSRFFSSSSNLENLMFEHYNKVAKQRYCDFNPNSPRITFDDQKQAEALLGRINEKISSIMNDAAKGLDNAMKSLSKSLEQKIPETIQESVEDILKKAEESLQQEGFMLHFNVPDPNIEHGEIDMAELLFSSLKTSRRTESSRGYREKEGKFGKAARWVGKLFNKDHWGYEEYIYTVNTNTYIVDMEEIQKNVFESLDTSVQGLSENYQIFFDETLEPLIERYFDNLKNYLEKFRGDLKDSIDDQRLNEEAKQQLMQRIMELKKQAEFHKTDVEIFKKNLK